MTNDCHISRTHANYSRITGRTHRNLSLTSCRVCTPPSVHVCACVYVSHAHTHSQYSLPVTARQLRLRLRFTISRPSRECLRACFHLNWVAITAREPLFLIPACIYYSHTRTSRPTKKILPTKAERRETVFLLLDRGAFGTYVTCTGAAHSPYTIKALKRLINNFVSIRIFRKRHAQSEGRAFPTFGRTRAFGSRRRVWCA